MLLGLFISILIMDVATVWSVRDEIIVATEMSLDAALVAGVYKEDRVGGKLHANEEECRYTAKKRFKENLKLNNQLENSRMKDTTFDVQLINNQGRPRVEVYVETYITTMSPKIFGMPGVPVRIHRIQHHLDEYN